MGGAHRLDHHAYDCRTVVGPTGVRIIRFRIIASPRLDTEQIRTLASLRKPRVTPVARVALGCLAVMAAAVTVVAGGRIAPPDLRETTVVTAAQLPLRAFVGPIATVDPPTLTPAPVVTPRARHVARPVPRVYRTVAPTVPDAPAKKSKHKGGSG
jgi:hypothetical protein